MQAFELVSKLISLPNERLALESSIKELKSKSDARSKKELERLEKRYEVVKDIKGEIKFKPNKELKDKVVTYHDPCHLGRHMALEMEQKTIEESKNLMFDMRKINNMIDEWYEVPRIVLRQLEKDVGIKFQEMYRVKLNSFCCGAGGGVRAGYPEFSLRTSSLRLDEANAVVADIITTECPFCWRNLFDSNDLYDHGLKVYGLLEMIDSFELLEVKEKPTLDGILKLK
jgi:heterodisulfide reductase subunit D